MADKTKAQLEQELQATGQKVGELEVELEELCKTRATETEEQMKAQISKLSGDIVELTKEKDGFAEDIAELQIANNSLQKGLEGKRQEIEVLKSNEKVLLKDDTSVRMNHLCAIMGGALAGGDPSQAPKPRYAKAACDALEAVEREYKDRYGAKNAE